MSGADLEYQAMLAKAGVNPANPAGYDAARLSQMIDTRDADEGDVNVQDLLDLVNTGRLSSESLSELVNFVSVADYQIPGGNDSDAIAAAVAECTSRGGGIVY